MDKEKSSIFRRGQKYTPALQSERGQEHLWRPQPTRLKVITPASNCGLIKECHPIPTYLQHSRNYRIKLKWNTGRATRKLSLGSSLKGRSKAKWAANSSKESESSAALG